MASRKLKTAVQVNKELMVEAAIKAVKERGLSENAAALEFGVCRMTMRRRIENPNPEPHGGKTKFPQWAEDILASFLALYAGKVHVQSRLDDTFDMIYHAVNSSGYMDQILFANYIKKEVLPAITELLTVIFVDGHFCHVNNLLLVRYCQDFFKDTGKRVEIFCLPVGQTNHLQPFDVPAFGGIKKKWHSYVGSRNALAGGMITKDNFLSHIVKLWFHKDGSPEKFAFRAGECLKSGFQKCGLFPFSPEVIRNTVKAHRDPNKFNCGVHIEAEREKDAKLAKLLLDEYDIVSQDKFGRIKEFILLTKQYIAPAAVLASALQKMLFEEAPKKQRRPTNKQLDLQSGAMVTAGEFVEVLVRNEAAKAAEAAAKKAKRNAPEPKTSKKTSNSVLKKKMKTA